MELSCYPSSGCLSGWGSFDSGQLLFSPSPFLRKRLTCPRFPCAFPQVEKTPEQPVASSPIIGTGKKRPAPLDIAQEDEGVPEFKNLYKHRAPVSPDASPSKLRRSARIDERKVKRVKYLKGVRRDGYAEVMSGDSENESVTNTPRRPRKIASVSRGKFKPRENLPEPSVDKGKGRAEPAIPFMRPVSDSAPSSNNSSPLRRSARFQQSKASSSRLDNSYGYP